MASKVAKAAMAGAHTAGIYADMTVDGPEIGTLVVIVDRAKHLPNRKAMGKQDPYCAARLGKEAKKTETDRRGGQTPRWDQELRFTVHDSPDYYRLKISVFNDDKKTDLIGETWIQLDDIMKPGGGKCDKWHSLSCKGRYAGEIQLELTFWDSRPKEERPAGELGASTSRSSLSHERSTEALGGPRQPGAVRRRPLPADPIQGDASSTTRPLPDHAHSAPLPQAVPRIGPRELNPHPRERHHAHAPVVLPSLGYDVALPKSFSQPQLASHGDASEYVAPDEMYLPPISNGSPHGGDAVPNGTYQVQPPPQQQHEQLQPTYQYAGVELPKLPPKTPRTSRSAGHQAPKYYSPQNSSNPSTPYTLPQYSTPQERVEWSERQDAARHSSVPPFQTGGEAYEESPVRQISLDEQHLYQHHRHDQQSSRPLPMPMPPVDPEGPPPPPPVHRSSGVGFVAPSDDSLQRQQYSPAPLNVRGVSASPLSYSEGMNSDYLPNPATESNLSTRSAPVPSAYGHHDRSRRHSNLELEQRGPPQAYPEMVHHQAVREHDSYRVSLDGSVGMGRFLNGHGEQAAPRPDPAAWRREEGVVMDDQPDVRDSRLRQRGNTHPAAADQQYYEQQAPTYPDPRVHRSAAPMIKPRAVSPNPQPAGANGSPRTPGTTRKSVSPAPAPHDSNGGLSSVPFSPDSFNSLNPNLATSSPTINAPGAKYKTPEGAREAQREREKEEKLEKEGPIIDSRGRVVDPSDHLPSDTWAPEPEKKTPRKTHEVKLKFRNVPSAAAGGPRAPREQPARHSLPNASMPSSLNASPAPVNSHQPSPTHHTPNNTTTTTTSSGGIGSAIRNRLQKRNNNNNNGSTVSPQQQPEQTSFTPPRQQQQQQTSYPLRERPLNTNYAASPSPSPSSTSSPAGFAGYDSSSKGLGGNCHPPQRSSPLAATTNPAAAAAGNYYHRSNNGGGSGGHRSSVGGPPPPIPEKIPLGMGQEDWVPSDRLSEELREIEIGNKRNQTQTQNSYTYAGAQYHQHHHYQQQPRIRGGGPAYRDI